MEKTTSHLNNLFNVIGPNFSNRAQTLQFLLNVIDIITVKKLDKLETIYKNKKVTNLIISHGLTTQLHFYVTVHT